MEEILDRPGDKSTVEPARKTVAKAKPTWREYLESDDATRFVYLIFALVAIAMVMGFLQSRTAAICCGEMKSARCSDKID